MKSLLPKILSAIALLTVLPMNARSLTPDEALSKAFNQPQRIGAKSNANFSLAKTIKAPSSSDNALYVFTTPNGEGCAIIAADDAVGNVLFGYTESGKYDEGSMPPAFKWWLDACANTVAEAAKPSDAQLLRNRLTKVNKLNHTPHKAAKSAIDFPAIDPLVSTQWNQSVPYNNMAPLMDGQRAVTGCVATAMAQIMKSHNWPEHGTGSNSYSINYNDYNYDISANFESTYYDWDNMLDSYYYGATTEQEDAVATLMLHCGVAAKMLYFPYGSGATTFDAARALINNFDYDKSLTYNIREWYTDDEWTELMYNELSQGRPILYTGWDISGGGHAFVCDGYSSEGYFHINWGWGGAFDGYFLLSVLDPVSLYFGVGSGESGYNYGQCVLTNIMPSTSNGKYNNIIALFDASQFGTSQSQYSREAGSYVTFNAQYLSYSFVLFEAEVGIRIIGEGTDTYVSSAYGTLTFNPRQEYFNPSQGYIDIPVYTTDIPLGTYEVYPAFKVGEEWHQMKLNKEINPTPLTMVVTDTEITFNTNPSEEEEGETTITTTLSSISHDGVDADETLYIGNTYDITYDIDVEGHFAYETFVALLKNNIIYCTSDEFVRIDVKNDKTQQTYHIEFDGIDPDSYEIGLVAVIDGGLYLVSDLHPVEVKEKEEDIPVVTDPNSGDVNGDNDLNVTDVVITIDYILGNNPSKFDKEAADINKDKTVNVTDVVMIIDKILNGK